MVIGQLMLYCRIERDENGTHILAEFGHSKIFRRWPNLLRPLKGLSLSLSLSLYLPSLYLSPLPLPPPFSLNLSPILFISLLSFIWCMSLSKFIIVLVSSRLFLSIFCLSFCLSVCLSFCLSVCIFVCLSFCLSFCLPFCLSFSLSFRLSFCLSFCLSPQILFRFVVFPLTLWCLLCILTPDLENVRDRHFIIWFQNTISISLRLGKGLVFKMVYATSQLYRIIVIIYIIFELCAKIWQENVHFIRENFFFWFFIFKETFLVF
jgi:hypothetical protein